MKRLRRLVPEVIQTSATDCGPAALQSLMSGFGLGVSYGRLREACQTDVDGTSISTMDEVANLLGLATEEIVVPRDHVFVEEAGALPAIAIVRQADDETHFVVVWSVLGGWVQIMDPAVGRRWIRRGELLDQLYEHEIAVPEEEWRDWAVSEEFLGPLRRQIEDLEVDPGPLLEAAVEDPRWFGLGALDAATRMVRSIVDQRGLARGEEADAVIRRFARAAVAHLEGEADALPIPLDYWSARPTAPDEEGGAQVLLNGAVLMRALGPQAPSAEPISSDLVAALQEPPPTPVRDLVGLLRGEGWVTPTALACAIVFGAALPLVEALVFRGLIDLGHALALPAERLSAIVAVLALVLLGLAVRVPVRASLAGLGRSIEVTLRTAFAAKVPRLGDRYFQSRLVSDMAERGHSVHTLRVVPELGEALLGALTRLVLTTVGIAWLDPAGAPFAVAAAVLVCALPFVFHPLLAEQALRVRGHLGGLSHFYLDALLGLAPVRAHGAARSVRREHEALLSEWARASLSLQRSAVWVEGLLTAAGFALGIGLILMHVARGPGGSTLLLVYWVLSLPSLGQQVALVARQYPTLRSVTLRLLEPLKAPDESPLPAAEEAPDESRLPAAEEAPDASRLPAAEGSVASSRGAPAGASLCFDGVRVRAGGLEILEGVTLSIEPGEHVGIVGPSGAGKSTLVGLLLGFYRPSEGSVEVDGLPLDTDQIGRLRRECAWVDPAVQLWGRSLLENLRYGGPSESGVHAALEGADLTAVLERLPDGLQTALGEGGGFVSAGEGQRIRLGRAFHRAGTRLALLDEPFRGLDRRQRETLLRRAREVWREATLLCVTHDVGETEAFDRVLVVEGGRIVEDGAPQTLREDVGSRYRSLLDAERVAQRGLGSDAAWRRLVLEGGRLREREDAISVTRGSEGPR